MSSSFGQVADALEPCWCGSRLTSIAVELVVSLVCDGGADAVAISRASLRGVGRLAIPCLQRVPAALRHVLSCCATRKMRTAAAVQTPSHHPAVTRAASRF